mgnify:CR=1 FL=1
MPWKPNRSISSPTRLPASLRARPSCGGIFDFDVKSERLAVVDARARRPEDLGRPAARAGARQGKKAARRRRRHADRRCDAASTTAASCSSSRARRATTRRCEAVQRRRREARAHGRRSRVPADVQQSDGPGQLLHRHPGRQRRHRGAGLGVDAAARCTCATASARAIATEVLEESPGEVAGIKSASVKVEGDYAYGYLRTGDRRAPPGAQEPVRFQRAPAHVVRERVRLSGSRRLDRGRHQSGRPAHRHVSARRAPAASTSTRPTPRCGSRTCRPTSSCSARTTARSTATARRRWRC